MSVTVYSKPNCVQCSATYRRLDKHGIDYEIIDITLDPEERDYAMSLGHLQAPVVVVDNESWGGYNPDRIDNLAKRIADLAA